MALDRHRLLSELGSVMNQLQSADCGCMGKLFSHPSGQQQVQQQPGGGSPLPTCGGCRRGCCAGHGGPSANSCRGGCNPPRLYADTYNYLNQNLMQPVVKEVYDDLSSLTPANTISNNPLAGQMGLSANSNPGNPMGGMGSTGGGYGMGSTGGGYGTGGAPNAMQNMGGMPSDNAMGANMDGTPGQMQGGNVNNMSNGSMGMGPQIVNMMMKGGGGRPASANPNMTGQGGLQENGMLIDAPHSPHGQVGVSPMNPQMGGNTGRYGGNMRMMGQGDPNAGHMMTPQTQYVTQDQTYTVGAAQGSPSVGGGMQNSLSTPPTHTMSSPGMSNMYNANASGNMAPGGQPATGQHSRGMQKFNEMFPGVAQGGDLGFDPMAIALQMNPANHKKAALNEMQKIMNNKTPNYGQGQPQTAPGNQVTNQHLAQGQPIQEQLIGQGQQQMGQGQLQMGQGQQQVEYPQPQMGQSQQQIGQGQQPIGQGQHLMGQGQQLMGQVQQPMGQVQQPMGQAQQPMGQTQQPVGQVQQSIGQGQQQIPAQRQGGAFNTGMMNQQQVYSATGAPVMSQQAVSGQPQVADPNSAPYQQTTGDLNASAPTEGSPPAAQEMYKEPIFPAVPSRDVYRRAPPRYVTKAETYYNTLGQPVEMIPGDAYRLPMPGLPQTLSPQATTRPIGKLGVKSTVSKTSIVGNRAVGRIPSRSQLQNIYQQYKGSNSYTQQNIPTSRPPANSGAYSDGNLTPIPTPSAGQQQVPIEKVGGDSAANNRRNNQIVNKMEIGQLGDVPTGTKPQSQAKGEEVACPVLGRYANLRNGLQDMICSSGPKNVSWSFHGEATPVPVSAAFRHNKRF